MCFAGLADVVFYLCCFEGLFCVDEGVKDVNDDVSVVAGLQYA